MSKNNKSLGLSTRLVRAGLTRSHHDETSEALYLNSGYVYETALEAEQSFDGTKNRYVYSRFANPTVTMFETRLASIEGAPVCRATSSGMAAVHATLLCYLKSGDRLVASKSLFSSCAWIIEQLLPRYNVETCFVDGTDIKAWKKALSKPTQMVFIETPSNPTLEIIDILSLSKLTHQAGGLLVVDNVFATPILQKPFELGADIVVYSTTKHIDGQGRCLGGAILCSDDFAKDHLGPFLRHTGPALSPFNAWVMLKGLETLALRMERHCSNALKIAQFLESHPAIEKVIYPGLPSHPHYDLVQKQMSGYGNIIAFYLKGGKDSAFHLLDSVDIIDISNNLGDAKSLMAHPWTTTHHSRPAENKLEQGITESLIRLSVGLEDVTDLINDLKRGLKT